MMNQRRLELQKKLEEILGNRNVYYQPPENLTMKYPAIRYSLTNVQLEKANNINYLKNREYEVILLDHSVESEYFDKILDTFTHCRFVRQYSASNLYHYVFEIYY